MKNNIVETFYPNTSSNNMRIEIVCDFVWIKYNLWLRILSWIMKERCCQNVQGNAGGIVAMMFL